MGRRFIGVDEKPASPSLILYGIQHVLAMFAGIVAVPLMVGTALKLPGDQMTILVQGSLLTSGIGTLIQCLGIGGLGARLPICMGTAFVFISPFISVGSNLGLQAILGAAIVGGIVEFILSFFVWRIQKLVPPVVTGTVVVLIGMGLMPLGFTWLAGGEGPLFGQPVSFAIGGLVLVLLILINQFTRGFFPSISIALAIVVGYLAAGITGILDLGLVKEASWIAMPKVFSFGPPKFSWPAILAVLVAQFASMLETIGDTYATGVVARKKIGPRELSGAIGVDGLLSSIAVVFNGLSITSFSQNIGVISITGVASRFAVAASGVILLLLGLVPKFAAMVAGMPAPVLGGAALVMFGAIAGSGILQFRDANVFGQREMLIFATSVALGMGFGLHPAGALDHLPSSLAVILGSGVAVGGSTAIILNRILPKKEDE
ncbi:nucleobase:cation symporter-2 family protein [Moorella sp. Hama-1]|uniref:nucleobase:cation symporter-2 family protein n=1 Tax=Moorella sp. Hama-1 TaxID=2138101 RepID=UPI000D6427B5|nr:nucleobase:cation symporter-2 family protein [Moorella sp. Hama-1]BCV22679.1 uracil-xanthine permease [Moorella sp. Hama-1]